MGFLFVIAVSSLGVYGITLAGWSSNSKYALLGGLRARAQMISYEVAMGLSLIPVLLMSGDVSFSTIVAKQQAGLWYVMPLFISFFIFTVAGFAETNRLPFDLPEAESELITGYHTEYSAMKFSFFFIAEYANVVTVCAMITTLFFGGWDIPFTDWDQSGGILPTLLTWLVFFLKVLFWVFFVMWIRWTLPRFRYDQLMALGWKVMMPLALVYIMVICGAIYLVEHVFGITGPVLGPLVLFGLNVGIARPALRGARQRSVHPGLRRPAEGSHGARRTSRSGGLMAIGVKVMKRPDKQVSYVRATLKGMALTFKHMLEKKVTMQYPEQKSTDQDHGMGTYTLSPRWRGTHRMLTDEQGRSKCVACGLCPQICPANCIKLVPGEDEEGNRYPLIYEIDEFRCIFCGYCQEVCPEEAIHVGVHFENSEYSRGPLRLRSGAALLADARRVDAVGPLGPRGRVDDPGRLLHLRRDRRAERRPVHPVPERHRRGPLAHRDDALAGGDLRPPQRRVRRRHPGAGVRRRGHGALPLRHHAAEPRPSHDRHARTRGGGHDHRDRRPAGDPALRAVALHPGPARGRGGAGSAAERPGNRVRRRPARAGRGRDQRCGRARSPRRSSRPTWYPSRSPRILLLAAIVGAVVLAKRKI